MAKVLAFLITGKDELSGVVNKAGKNVEKSSTGMVGSLKATSVAWLAMGAVITGVFAKAIGDARNLNLVKLKTAAKDAGIAWSTLAPQVSAAGSAMTNFGFSQGEVNQSLTKLITATGNSALSIKALTSAADLARYKNISLADSSQLLAQASAGNTRALRQLGVATNELPKKFASTGTSASRLAVVMDIMNKKIGGQAAAYAQTYGGKIEILKAKFTNLSAQLGMVLIPVLSLMMTGLIKVMDAFSSLPGPVKYSVVALLMVAAAAIPVAVASLKIIGAFKAMKKAVQDFEIASKLAAVANPWVLLAVAIGIIVLLIITHWNTVKKITLEVWGAIYNFLRGCWGAIKQGAVNDWHAILAFFQWVWQAIKFVFYNATIIGLVLSHWQAISDGTHRIWNNLIGWLRGVPGWIRNIFGPAINWLNQAGRDVIQGFWNGLTYIWGKVTSWISGLAGWIKAHKGPLSLDQTLLEPAGRALMSGLKVGLLGGFQDIQGIVSGAASNIGNWIGNAGGAIGNFFGKLFGGGSGSGVQRWAGLVAQVLAMFGQPLSLVPVVLRRMNQESGGNPFAQNNWDINAQNGDPSRGLMQTIGATFNAFAGPFRSRGIFDPFANIYASFGYALSRYGSLAAAFNRAGGYAKGTTSARRGWAWVGEAGPELMHFNGGEQVGPLAGARAGGGTVVINVNIQGHALATKQEIGRTVADALAEFKRKGGRLP